MSYTPRDVIKRAMRMNTTYSSSEEIQAVDEDDALITLNQLQRALFGEEIGVPLVSEVAATGTVRHGALYECGASAVTLTCPLKPKPGNRFGIADVKSNLSSNNVTVAPNGRKFKGSASNTALATDDTYETYFFREDTGDWVLEVDWALSDTIYFPDNMIEWLVAMLALGLCEEYGKAPSTVVQQKAAAGRAKFRGRYGRRGVSPAQATTPAQ